MIRHEYANVGQQSNILPFECKYTYQNIVAIFRLQRTSSQALRDLLRDSHTQFPSQSYPNFLETLHSISVLYVCRL